MSHLRRRKTAVAAVVCRESRELQARASAWSCSLFCSCCAAGLRAVCLDFAHTPSNLWPVPLPLAQIRELVGEITEEALTHVDVALTRNVGLFVPLSGPCGYAITPEHTHPAYSFVVSFDDRCRVAIDGKVLRSQPGRFTAFSPRVPHQELPSSGVSRYVAVLLSEPYLHAELTDYGVPLPELRGESFVTPPRLVDALREFMAEYEEQGPGCQALLEASGKRIAHLLSRAILACPKLDERIDLRMAANHAVSMRIRLAASGRGILDHFDHLRT